MTASPTRPTFESRSGHREGPFRALFESSIDAILIADDSRRYVDANPAACELLGIERSHISRYHIDDFAAPNLREHIEEAWSAFLKDGTQRGEYELIRTDGSVRFVEFSATANFIPGRHLSSLRDVTDRKKVEQSLRRLSAKLLQLQDDERRHIARELHDSAGQKLAALAMTMYSLIEKLQESAPKCAKQAEEAQSLVEQLSQEIRTTSYLLHPPMLDELGLDSALRWCIEGFEKRSGIKTQLELEISGQRLPAELERTIFRTVQEALTNIHRHSGSQTAFIRLRHNSNNVVLEIQDQGKGIERNRLNQLSAGMASSVGLQGMRERIFQFGGDLQLLSDDHGLTIKAVIPLPSRSAATA